MFLDDMEFGFEAKRNEMLKPTINCIAPLAVAAIGGAISIAGSLMSKDDGPEQFKPEILPSTVSSQLGQDMNFVFDLEAGQAMADLTGQMNDWSATDRSFFENTFQPFQASLIEANQSLIPGIVANAGESMKSVLKDLMGGDFLKDAFRSQVEASGGDVSKFAESFSKQIDNIPTAEQRIGEAVSGVEQRFGEAGAELKRQMGAQGLDVTQASKRDLAIEKAKAKASATDQAAEASRKEQLAGAEAGVGVSSTVQQSQAGLLATRESITQAGANLAPQISGVQAGESLGAAGQVGAQLTQTGAERVLGTTTDTRSAEFTQKGVVSPAFFDKETGKAVDAAGNPIAPPAPTVIYRNQAPSRQTSIDAFGGGPGVGGADSSGGAGVVGADTGGMGGGGLGASGVGDASGGDVGLGEGVGY